MNTVVALASTLAAAFAQVSAVSVCKQSELGSLVTNKNTTLCGSESGVVLADLDGAPSDDQLTSMCETESCLYLMEAILAINPEDCTLVLNENLNLMSEFVDPVVQHCTAMGIEINGSSLVGSGDVSVGDESEASALGSGASGSSGAVSMLQSSTASTVALALAIVLASTH